jgi:putative sensory transduction regulator
VDAIEGLQGAELRRLLGQRPGLRNRLGEIDSATDSGTGWQRGKGMKMALKWLAAAAALGAFAHPAYAQMVRAQDPQSLVNAMQGAGYTAKLGVDKVGDPKIDSSVSGSKFTLFFYNCTDNKACATVQFHSGYDVSTAVPLERINEWNQSQRFGRAYLDKEGDPVIEMDLDLDDGGVSTALFTDNLEFWDAVLGKFERHIGFRTE